MVLTQDARLYRDPERMAADFLRMYFGAHDVAYPINPFQMLNDAGITFAIREFSKLEGVYIPATSEDDLAIVGININRPITRQRFTAAHELCHHFRDADKQIPCPIGNKNEIEKFADKFAAAVLMPYGELLRQVDIRRVNGYVDYDSVLQISDYFGVSFESCLFRIAYTIHAIEGNTEADELRKQARKYKPDIKRIERGMSYARLYEGLIDAYSDMLSFEPNDYARFVFQNNYIYNDSRMEGVDTTVEQASEIVSDLRLNMQHSIYCTDRNEAFLSIAGHYLMYNDILALPEKESCSVFDIFSLNRKLYSCYPYPEFGGKMRESDTLVLGAKFETITFTQIMSELIRLEPEVKALYSGRSEMLLSSFVERVAQVHHRLTVIHPFSDGNGRTLRAFMNILLIRGHVYPIYIRAEEKETYFTALEVADTTGKYDQLKEVIFKALLRSSVELSKT